jgi:hypothetical protein
MGFLRPDQSVINLFKMLSVFAIVFLATIYAFPSTAPSVRVLFMVLCFALHKHEYKQKINTDSFYSGGGSTSLVMKRLLSWSAASTRSGLSVLTGQLWRMAHFPLMLISTSPASPPAAPLVRDMEYVYYPIAEIITL